MVCVTLRVAHATSCWEAGERLTKLFLSFLEMAEHEQETSRIV